MNDFHSHWRSTIQHPVRHELTHHRYLRERLEAAFPDADEETLMVTLVH